jgi:hypothetical protein
LSVNSPLWVPWNTDNGLSKWHTTRVQCLLCLLECNVYLRKQTQMIDWDRWYDTLGGLTHFPMGLINSGGLRNEMVHEPCAHRCDVSEEGKLLQHCSMLSCCVGWGRKTKEIFLVFLRLIEM